MSLLILAYPEINKDDYNWIQSIREKYDDRFFKVVEPHFTIVFPVFNIDEPTFIKHAEEISTDISPIDFSIKCSIIVKDSFSNHTDLFLVPDTGNSDIIKLHDKFYTGILLSELRLDIPFIPHIGIGGSANPEECKKISDMINANEFCLLGRLNSLDIVWYEYPKVNTLKKIQLQ